MRVFLNPRSCCTPVVVHFHRGISILVGSVTPDTYRVALFMDYYPYPSTELFR